MKELLYQAHILLATLLSPRENRLHSARFAYFHELAKYHVDKRHISKKMVGSFLGVDKHNQLIRTLPNGQRKLQNVGVFAPTGGGKSLYFTTQLLTWPYSAVVNDPKGELHALTAGAREKELHNRIIVIDPTGKGNKLDPLCDMKTEDAFYSVATQFLHRPNEVDGRAFTERAINMLTQLFLAAKGKPAFPFIRGVTNHGWIQVAEQLQRISPDLATGFLDVEYHNADFTSRFLADSYATMRSALRPIVNETVVQSLNGSDFDLSEAVRGKQPVTIYLRWPEEHILSLRPLIKLIWGTIVREFKNTFDNYNGVDCFPVNYFVDEGGIAPVPDLPHHIATVNARNQAFTIGYQSKSQIEENYGRFGAETILNNLRVKLFYQQESYETALYVCKCLGDTSGFAQSHTEHDGEETSSGETEEGFRPA